VHDVSEAQSQGTVWLLRSVAEQLKVPLTTIARYAELQDYSSDSQSLDLAPIRTHAAAALTLVDSYLLGLQLMRDQTSLLLEPVSVSSILTEAAHELSGLAGQYNTRLELHLAGKYGPVMAHQFGLKAAILALGYGLLEGGPRSSTHPDQPNSLVLAAHRTTQGITTGIYGEGQSIDSGSWRRAASLKHTASQPMSAVSGSGAGLFVADAILQAMDAQLRVGKYRNRKGLATTLPASQQLAFV